MEDPKENVITMQKNIRLWEVLTAFSALCTVVGIVIWNIYTSVIETKKDVMYNSTRVDRLEKSLEEYRSDIRDINKNVQAILIKIESKQDRP